jgi:hypothetical protein
LSISNGKFYFSESCIHLEDSAVSKVTYISQLRVKLRMEVESFTVLEGEVAHVDVKKLWKDTF